MASDTTIQQRAVLLVALLGVRRIQQDEKPTRKQVLSFIRIKNLIAWNDHEIEWSDAGCIVGENQISWRRKDLVKDGLLKPGPSRSSWSTWHLEAPGRTEYGIWELTGIGVAKIEHVVKDWSEKFDKDNKFFSDLKSGLAELKLTDEFMNIVLQLAKDDFTTKFFPRL